VKNRSLRYLNENDVSSLNITLDDVLLTTEKALAEHAHRAFEMTPKLGIHPFAGSFINAMPAFLSDLKIAGMKWVSYYPENWKRRLPTISGLLLLNDWETGRPLCILDAIWLTGVRTAAISGIAAKHFSRKNPRVLGIIGAGTQGRFNTGMIKHTCPSIQEVIAFDIMPQQLKKFQILIHDAYGLAVEPASDPEDVFRKSNIVVTATGKQDRPVVKKAWLRQGGLYVGLEAFQYWGQEALLSSDKFVTDDWNQTKAFLADAKHIRRSPQLFGELSQVVIGTRPGRETTDERIICIFIGMAIVDIALGNLIYNLALEKRIGRVIE